jgi:plasmid stability protein
VARLYVRNVPDEQYEALPRRAAKNHRSISAEVVAMLEETFLTARELEARRSAAKMTTKNTTTGG